MIGLGYYRQPTAALIGSQTNVIDVDNTRLVLEPINQGKIRPLEPELDIREHGAVMGGLQHAVTKSDLVGAFLVLVPSAFIDDHHSDLCYIEKTERAIAPVLMEGIHLILESTLPVGSSKKCADWLTDSGLDPSLTQHVQECADVRMACWPEHISGGRIVHDQVDNDRIIGRMTREVNDCKPEWGDGQDHYRYRRHLSSKTRQNPGEDRGRL